MIALALPLLNRIALAFLVLAICVLLLTGCAQGLASYQGYRAEAIQAGGSVMDQIVADSQETLCRVASLGAYQRATAQRPDVKAAWDQLCAALASEWTPPATEPPQ